MQQTNLSVISEKAVIDGTNRPEYPPFIDRLVHVLHIVSSQDSKVIEVLNIYITELGTKVDNVRIGCYRQLPTLVVSIRSISQAEVRAVRDCLQKSDCVLRVRLEHIYV